jgi:cell division protein FtsQ
MAKDSAKTRRTLPVRAIVRYGLIAVAMCLVLAGGISASERLQQFLTRDPRFFLPGPPDYGMESPNLELHGVKYASRARILLLFDPDYGRSLFDFPLADRRKALLKVTWVHDASIERIWPNRIVVNVWERNPVAFVRVPSDGMTRWALIDAEGAILEPPLKAPFRLPLLAGVSLGESPDKRARRVRRMQQLMKDLGTLSEKVSEVDAGDLDSLKISEQVQGRAVSLLLGDRNFSSRLKNFLLHYPDIHRKMPQASTFDLRLDDRITGLEDPQNGR